MITKETRQHYDGSWRIVTYEPRGDGTVSPQLAKCYLDDDIDSFFVQRAEELERLRGRLDAGQLSPIGFFLELQHLSIRDAAARMKMRRSKVRRHATPEGFASVDVATLGRYARMLGVRVADFFQFTELSGDLVAESKTSQDGLVQTVRVSGPG